MSGVTQLRTGLLAGVMLAVLFAGLPTPAQAQERPGEPTVLATRDPELAEIARDIILLRMINRIGLTREQINKVIPALEGAVRDERAMRDEVKTMMLEQRRALLAGDIPEEQLEASRQKMKERAQTYREQTRRRIETLGLSDDQTRQLRGLVLAGPAVWRGAVVAPSGPGPAPGRRTTEGRRSHAPSMSDEGGPSAVVLERVIALLKEKLEVMGPAA